MLKKLTAVLLTAGAFVFLQMPVFRVHAPLHQGVALRGGDGGENNVGNLRHDLAEQGDEHLRVHRQMAQTFLCKLNIVALCHQRPGIPQGAVNVKNQTF